MNKAFFSIELLKEGKRLLDAGAVKDLEFFEGSYQFTVKPPNSKEYFYPFLHVDDEGIPIDALCECDKGLKGQRCAHLAASWLIVLGSHLQPLHLRFRRSFWHAIFMGIAEVHNFSFDSIRKKRKQEWVTTGFSFKALEESVHNKFSSLFDYPQMTLENSLKFSSLSQEERILLKEGRASPELLFNLSPWSLLAEWFFMKQEGKEKYTVAFENKKNSLPELVRVHFKDLDVEMEIEKRQWSRLIPTLSSINSSLRVFFSQYPPISKASYDEEKQILRLQTSPFPLSKQLDKVAMLTVGDWFFIPDLGFFPLHQDKILGEEILEGEKIAKFFDRHWDVVREVLTLPIDPKLHLLKRSLNFVENIGLVIEEYLFIPGDLARKGVARFGSWVYLPDRGFFKTKSSGPVPPQTVPIEQISSFIAEHRLFLLEHEGFQTHLSTIDSVLGYDVDGAGNLYFFLSLEEGGEPEGVFDLGEWVYIRSRGFYPKVKQSGVLRAGLVLSKAEVPFFIKKHANDLEMIAGFFSLRSPIAASGITITLNHEERIVVSPSYQMAEEYAMQTVRIFGSYTYVKKEGFCEIPSSLQLPQHFAQERVIPASKEAYFVLHQLDMLKPYLLQIDNRLIKPEVLVLKLRRFKKSASRDLKWNLELFYESAIGNISIFEVRRAIVKNKSYIFSSAGLILLDLPRFTWIKELPPRAFKQRLHSTVLTTIECLKLAACEEVVDKQGKILLSEDWQVLFDSFLKQSPPIFEGLKSVLRPYQSKGVEWLWMLYRQGLSGLLCDEMGLGKTHQAMALIAALRNLDTEKKTKRILVVCPTSVIFHWQELFSRFLPIAGTYIFHGMQRDEEQLKEDIEIIITSYGIVRAERRLFKQLRFSLAIFDEMQVAKNAQSLTHQSLKNIDAGMRLGLTGTPIENHLFDLKALFDLVLPNYLPKGFEQFYGDTSQWEADPKKKHFLKQLINPFILRRKKSEVLTELPEKIEEVYYCSLSLEQEKLYKECIQKGAGTLLTNLQEEVKSFSLVHIFALLTRLKQICDHPCLVLPNEENYFAHASGKWDLFIELLNEARESGQKVVVFSQFLKMLDIIEAYLDEKGIGHAGIRGSTQDRKLQVSRFRDDPTCEVFVASLQAAGVGIDLVAASVVIHYDRWWNPAKENQATDRVHRIGQDRGVQVFKLVAKHTIEEHIDQLIQRKTRLVKETIGYDEQDILKQFDREELIELLQKSLT